MNKLLLMLIASFLLSSCKNIKIPNLTACAHYSNSVYCKETLSNKEAVYNVNRCENFVHGRISMSTEDWVELKRFILKICKKSKKCRKEAPGLTDRIQELEDKAKGV